MFSFTCSISPRLGSSPCPYRSFWLQGRRPLREVSLAGVAGTRPAHTAELQAPITEMCVTPSVIPLLLTQVRFGKDGHFRATGDNQIRSHSIKYFLDYAKGVREWDAEEKPRWHRKCLVLMTYSTWKKPNFSKCNQHTPTGPSAHGEGRHLVAPGLPSLSNAQQHLCVMKFTWEGPPLRGCGLRKWARGEGHRHTCAHCCPNMADSVLLPTYGKMHKWEAGSLWCFIVILSLDFSSIYVLNGLSVEK